MAELHDDPVVAAATRAAFPTSFLNDPRVTALMEAMRQPPAPGDAAVMAFRQMHPILIAPSFNNNPGRTRGLSSLKVAGTPSPFPNEKQ